MTTRREADTPPSEELLHPLVRVAILTVVIVAPALMDATVPGRHPWGLAGDHPAQVAKTLAVISRPDPDLQKATVQGMCGGVCQGVRQAGVPER